MSSACLLAQRCSVQPTAECEMRAEWRLFEIVPEHVRADRLAKLAQRLGFDLPDPLAGHPEMPADLFKGPGAAVIEPISHVQYVPLPIGKCACLLYTSPSPRDGLLSRMPSSA